MLHNIKSRTIAVVKNDNNKAIKLGMTKHNYTTMTQKDVIKINKLKGQ